MHPAGHQRGIHARPCDGAVGHGHQVGAGSLQAARPFQIGGQVGVLGGVQLHGDHLFAGPQLAQEGVIGFHFRAGNGGDLCRRDDGQPLRQGIQCLAQGRDVGRGGAAAAAQDAHPLSGQPGQLGGKIVRLAPVLHLGAGDHRIARVGHDRQWDAHTPQLLHQRAHGARCRHTVQAHGIHKAAVRHAAHQRPAVLTLAGVAVRQHRKGHLHKGIRHRLTQSTHGVQNTDVAAQGLEQVVLCPQGGKPPHHRRVHLGRRQALGVRGGAKVGKHGGVRPGRCLCRQLPACVGQCLPLRVLSRRHAGQAEGIRLDGIGSRRQIGAVDRPDALRVQPVCLLTFPAGGSFIIGAHAAVEQQRAFFQQRAYIAHGGGSPFPTKALGFQFNAERASGQGFSAPAACRNAVFVLSYAYFME